MQPKKPNKTPPKKKKQKKKKNNKTQKTQLFLFLTLGFSNPAPLTPSSILNL